MSTKASVDKKFDEIRDNFFKAYKDNIEQNKYHKLDVARLRASNDWLKAFYKFSGETPERTLPMLDEVLTWRNEFGTNGKILPFLLFHLFLFQDFMSIMAKLNYIDLLKSREPPVPEELFKKGAMFMKNEDINCVPICENIGYFNLKANI